MTAPSVKCDRSTRRLASVLVVAAFGLTACGGAAGASPGAVTTTLAVPEASTTTVASAAPTRTAAVSSEEGVAATRPSVLDPGTTTTSVATPIEPATTAPTLTTVAPSTEPPLTLPLITLETVPPPLPTLPAAPPPPTTVAPSPASSGGGSGGGGLGRIEIPKLGVSAGLQSGVALSVLDRGPGHWPGTALPGQPGNVVVAGHRTSHGGIFRYINTLVPGDQIIFENGDGRFVYAVTGTQIVNPDAMWIIGQGGGSRATLFACHPPGSTAQRIVVFAKLSG
jgi:sortase A